MWGVTCTSVKQSSQQELRAQAGARGCSGSLSGPVALPLTFPLSLAPAYFPESKFCHVLKVNYFYAKEPPVFGDTCFSPANGKSWHQHLKACSSYTFRRSAA